MPNPYGWGDDKPQIKPKDQGGDTIATFSQKVYNLFENLFNTLNGYPWATATQLAAGYMSATDKTNLDTLLAYDAISHTATPDTTTLATGAVFEYRNLGAFTIAYGYGKLLTATATYGARKIATGVPVPAWSTQPKCFIYFDNSTYYGAWGTVDTSGSVYINTRAVSIPANLLFYMCLLYPRAL